MASTSETGHNKNVANFSSAYQILQEMGTLYNPSNTNILLANLDPVKTEIATKITALNDKKPVYKNAVANREIKISMLGSRSTKVLNYFKSINVSDTDKENLANQVKKIRGDQKPKKVNPETADGGTISTSQMSYDSRIANLDTLTTQLNSHPEYSPNEDEIKVATLQAFQQELVSLSSLVNASGNALITARKDRNDILYFNENNIIKLMQEVKAYIKSLGQVGEPTYKALVKLKFTDLKK